jgi:hypothetical protein
MAQLAPDNPVLANAGIIAQKKVADPKYGDVASLVIRGHALLNPNTKTDGKSGGTLINLPPEREFQKVWDDTMRNAYAGSAEAKNADFQTAKAIYATLSQAAGDPDTSIFDRDRWDASMKMATGGALRLGSSTILKPRGMTDGDFADQRDLRLRALHQSGVLDPGMTMSKLRDMGLRNEGGGRYVLTTGDADLADKNGRRVVIDFEAPLPTVSAPKTTTARELEQQRLERVRAAREVKRQ